MEPLLYVLIALISILIIVVTIFIVLTMKTKKNTVLPEIKVDQAETINRLNYVQDAIAKLKLEMDKAFNERFTAQTEKLNEADAKFLKEVRSEIDLKLEKLNKSVEEKLRLDNEKGEKTFEDLGKKLQAIVEANKEVVSLGDDVKKLNEVISGGGTRKGRFGEFLLESILEQVYDGASNMYATQYTLGSVRPDAVIFLPRDKGNIICIDAKFTYDNYARIFEEDGTINEVAKRDFKSNLKDRIDEVASKYIISGQTTDFALCFFPSDEIHQYINTEKNFAETIKYARRKNVVLVSPATLQPTLHTLKSLMIEYRRSQKLSEVNKMIIDLAKEFTLLKTRYDSFMNSFDTLLNKRDPLDITVNKLTKKFNQIKDDSEIEEEE